MAKKKKGKKKGKNSLLASIRNRVESGGGDYTSDVNLKKKKTYVRLFEPPKGMYEEVPTHYVPLGGKKWFVEPCHGDDCPVCIIMRYKQMQAAKKGREIEEKDVRPSSKFHIPCFEHRTDDEGVKVKILKAPWTVFQGIGEQDEEYPLLASKKKGQDVIIIRKVKNDNTKYSVLVASKRTPLTDEELKAIEEFGGAKSTITFKSLDDILEALKIDEKSFKKMKKKINQVEEEDEDEDEVEEEESEGEEDAEDEEEDEDEGEGDDDEEDDDDLDDEDFDDEDDDEDEDDDDD